MGKCSASSNPRIRDDVNTGFEPVNAITPHCRLAISSIMIASAPSTATATPDRAYNRADKTDRQDKNDDLFKEIQFYEPFDHS